MDETPHPHPPGSQHDRSGGVSSYPEHPVRPEVFQYPPGLGIAVEEHCHPLHLRKAALPPDTGCRDAFQAEAEPGEYARLNPLLGADEQHLIPAFPGQEFLGHRYAGEKVAAGAAAGNNEFHCTPRTRLETFNSTPTAKRVMIRELPP